MVGVVLLMLLDSWAYLAISGLLAAGVVYGFGLHRQSWHRVGLRDLRQLVSAVTMWTTLCLIIAPAYGAPYAVPVIAGMAALIGMGAARMGARQLYQSLGERAASVHHRVLIVGAGEAGTLMAREMLRHPDKGLMPVGFVDDDKGKRGQSFVGLPVHGTVSMLGMAARKTHATQVLIAVPSAGGDFVKRVVAAAREAQLVYRIIPPLHDILSGSVSISSIREVAIEDLLQRDPVRLELDRIAGYLEGQVVMVSGAGGSIGSEIVVQLARFRPRKVILVGRGENSLYALERQLDHACPELNYHSEVCDVRRRDALDRVFARHRPSVVFHAAAHKHVPLMEGNSWEAIFNNVGGTLNLVNVALGYGVQHLVNVSTDKAVNPSSIMGASKRVAEFIVQRASKRAAPGQSYVSVRFGNVLGSRGSVIPLFQQQIRHGGPLTLTHPDMTRYFMTIPEAAQLVLQAGGMHGNGSVYVLDMGQPIRIIDLAEELVRLSGLVPNEDVQIVYRGMRPGEKLFEELLTAEEGTNASHHEKIFVAKGTRRSFEQFDDQLEELFRSARVQNTARVKSALQAIIPTYAPPEGFGTEDELTAPGIADSFVARSG